MLKVLRIYLFITIHLLKGFIPFMNKYSLCTLDCHLLYFLNGQNVTEATGITSICQLMPKTGIEPMTRGTSTLCSTNWAIWTYIGFFALPQISMPGSYSFPFWIYSKTFKGHIPIKPFCSKAVFFWLPQTMLRTLFYFVASALKGSTTESIVCKFLFF